MMKTHGSTIITHSVDYPSTKAEAKKLGKQFYFTGKPCRRGHVALRNTSNAVCRSCQSDDNQKLNKAFIDRNFRFGSY
jgi:hypothetical protein